MRDPESRAAPLGSGALYLALVLTGIVLGFLCGAEQVDLGALLVFGAGGIAVFLAWTIWRMDPDYLLTSKHYRDEPSDSEPERD